MWDIYDLAQEFLPPETQNFYQKPNKPRPVNNEDEYLSEDDDNNDSDLDSNNEDLHDLFGDN